MTAPTEHDLLLAALRFQGGAHAPTFLPGQPPQAAPAPLPELAGLLGAVEGADPSDYSAALYFLPVPQGQQDELLRRVNAALEGAGWRIPQRKWPRFQPSGFQATDAPPFPDLTQTAPGEPDPAQRLVHDGAGLGAVWDSREEAGETFLQLTLRADLYRHLTWEEGESPLPPLPPLNAPDGWTLEPIGGGSNGSGRAAHGSSLALLRGAGTLNDLYAHFAGQLDNCGWDEQGAVSTADAALTISRWQTPEGDLGLLTLTERGPGLWQAGLEVTRLGHHEPGRSWFSF